MALIPPPATPVKPFDMGAPPAELPQGSSNLPAFDALPDTATREHRADLPPAPLVEPVVNQYSLDYAEWRSQCAMRKAWIEAHNTEWRRRVDERRKAIEVWDQHVAEARYAYQAARAVPAPERPSKR